MKFHELPAPDIERGLYNEIDLYLSRVNPSRTIENSCSSEAEAIAVAVQSSERHTQAVQQGVALSPTG